jgi:hypothetical protein
MFTEFDGLPFFKKKVLFICILDYKDTFVLNKLIIHV